MYLHGVAVLPVEWWDQKWIEDNITRIVKDGRVVILDSGIRRGSHIVKALSLGAKMVLVGRATLYGTACGGQAGAARAIKILADEMERSFGYVGARRVSEIGPHIFAHYIAHTYSQDPHERFSQRAAAETRRHLHDVV